MSKVEKIEQEVASLSPSELASFRAWYLAFDSDAWDRQIESDVASGKLDQMVSRALEDHRNGKSSPL